MTALGEVAICAAGGTALGPLLELASRRSRAAARRPMPDAPELEGSPERTATPLGGASGSGPATASAPVPRPSADAGAVDALEPAAPAPPPLAALRPADAIACGVLTGGLSAIAAVRLGAVPQLAAYCLLFGALVVLSATDLRTGLVPRRIVYASLLVVGVALLAASAVDADWRPMVDALAGGAGAFVVFAAIWWFYPKGMGFGDVRLAGLCGGALGWLGFLPLYLGFLSGFVAGALAGTVLLLRHGRRRMPFAPALAFGTVFGVLWGGWLGDLWLHAR